jgi:LPXTG-site transpeptidase (sortase) family protein
MKTSVAIALSLVVGALVALAVLPRGSNGQIAGSASPGAEPAAAKAAMKTMPSRSRKHARPAPAPASPPRLNVPRLRLKAEIGSDLDRGPAWWPVTGRPGGGDTIAIAGHRTTHTRPFYWLDRVRPGDRIYIRWQGRVHAYRMSGRRILSANNLHIADARGHELLLLTACTPRGSARQRIVVYAWPVTKHSESRAPRVDGRLGR